MNEWLNEWLNEWMNELMNEKPQKCMCMSTDFFPLGVRLYWEKKRQNYCNLALAKTDQAVRVYMSLFLHLHSTKGCTIDNRATNSALLSMAAQIRIYTA